jgi:hypothetical protein
VIINNLKTPCSQQGVFLLGLPSMSKTKPIIISAFTDRDIELDVEVALNLLGNEGNESMCEHCDLSVGHICEFCFLYDLILRMRNKIRNFKGSDE